MAMANLPMVPPVLPSHDQPGAPHKAAAGDDPLPGHAGDRSPDQWPLRPDRRPRRPRQFALVPCLRPGQDGSGRAPLRRSGHQGDADRGLRWQSQHADDDPLRGRRLPARGDRQGHLRPRRAPEGEKRRRGRRLPGRDDRGQRDQGNLARTFASTSSHPRPRSSRFATRSTPSPTTATASRWDSS